ncbi:hypothetical protein BHY_1156 (plasmid) [Borrelia nietonii YOR]|uniref:Lipoprotein n=1 Tax=Borrelia nietonii YOR TaxID=1293576 RepID=W5SAX0_9SPIR|nr:hypothetical protein [Borrelia nietonii]AHH04107.1 hypothetical protein BHY_1156 [Borrelia nietonii YOR]
MKFCNIFNLKFSFLFILFGCDLNYIGEVDKFSGMASVDFEYENKKILEREKRKQLEEEKRAQLEKEARARYYEKEFERQAEYYTKEFVR